jgi:CRISPR type III-A-associated protein Csm2
MYKNPKYKKQKFSNKTQNNKKQNSENSNPINEFISFLEGKEEKDKKCLSEYDLRILIGPQGYADKIAKHIVEVGSKNKNERVNITQLRKFFSEIKEISKLGQKEPQRAQVKLWKLYPLIAYAQGRKVISKDFADMLNQVLEKVDNNSCNKPEDYKMLEDFMTALVAYFKKYNPKG